MAAAKPESHPSWTTIASTGARDAVSATPAGEQAEGDHLTKFESSHNALGALGYDARVPKMPISTSSTKYPIADATAAEYTPYLVTKRNNRAMLGSGARVRRDPREVALASTDTTHTIQRQACCKIEARPYGVGRPFGLTAGVGRTLLAGVCLAGEWLRLTPKQ
jgi:hypothetical protein